MIAKTERSESASSHPIRGPLRAGPAYHAEPGKGPEGGSGPYLTVLCCSLEVTGGLAPLLHAPQLTQHDSASRGSHEPTDRR
jgi:hypothetical protein